MRRLRLQGLLAVAGLASLLLAVQSAQADDAEAWATLKQPGHVALLRHANAPGDTPEPYGIDLKDCSIQRMLDEAGRAQARRLGDAFRARGIAKAQLVSSEFCRALETARLTRLGPVQPLPALNLIFIPDFLMLREASAKVRAFMKTIPPGQVAVLVTHIGNIQGLAGTTLDSGEFAVVHLDQDGTVVVDGRIKVP